MEKNSAPTDQADQALDVPIRPGGVCGPSNAEVVVPQWGTQEYAAGAMGLTGIPADFAVHFMVDEHFTSCTRGNEIVDSPCLVGRHITHTNDHLYDYKYDRKSVSCKHHEDVMRYITEKIMTGTGEVKEIAFNPQDITDDNIHLQMYERFGPMDKTSSKYDLMFKGYKEGVLEEYSVRIEEANEVIADCGLTDRTEVLEHLQETMIPVFRMGFMTKAERIEKPKINANMYKSGWEPFNVPREDPKQFVMRNAQAEEDGEPEVDDEYWDLQNDDEQVNLTFYEPTLENLQLLTFEGDLQFPLVRSILSVLWDFPLGTTPGFLFQEFERRNNYSIDFIGLGFDTFVKLLQKNDNVFTVIQGKTLILVFPVWKETTAVDVIQKRVYHYLLSLMRLVGKPVPTEELVQRLRDMFGIRLNLKAWGFETEALYYRVLLSLWDQDALEVVETYPEDWTESRAAPNHLLRLKEEVVVDNGAEMNWNWQAEFAALGLTKKPVAPPPPVRLTKTKAKPVKKKLYDETVTPQDFVYGTDLMETIGDAMEAGAFYYALPELMVTPVHFYISLQNLVDDRDMFMNEMTDAYEKWLKSDSAELFKVTREHVQKDAYVVLNFEDDWVRGRIIDERPRGYKVLLVDLGMYVRRIKVRNMKYLHKYFADTPEYCVRVGMPIGQLEEIFGEETLHSDTLFTEEELQTFYDLLSGRVLGIMPEFWDEARQQWELFVFQCAKGRKGKGMPIIEDFAEELGEHLLDGLEESCPKDAQENTSDASEFSEYGSSDFSRLKSVSAPSLGASYEYDSR